MAFSGATREMCKAALEAARPAPAGGGQATGGLPAFVYSPEF